ncbi:MAG: agmatinase [Acidobacteriota bacterium]
MNYRRADPLNFLGIRGKESEKDFSRILILPVPYETSTSFIRGTKLAPMKIIEASNFLEYYEEEMGWEPYKLGIHTLEPVELSLSIEASLKIIEEAAEEIISSDRFIIFLGGEHTISYPIVKALLKKRENKFSVLQLDAHPDIRDIYEGTKFSHSCVMRRILEIGVEITGLGIRAISLEERKFIRENTNYRLFEMSDILKEGWENDMLDSLNEDVYLSIDMDVFDPSIVPGVGTPEPGGMTWEKMTSLLRKLSKKKKIIGADFVEISPIPLNPTSEYTTAKLIYKLISYIFG